MKRSHGFTIVELIVVVVVIAILASIVVLGYNGITRGAIETSIQSDLRTASSQLSTDYRLSNNYPLTASEANNGKGLMASNGSVINYSLRPYGYCLFATNPKTTKSYTLSSSTGKIEEGACTYSMSTFAGSTTAGYADGTSTVARFDAPYGGGLAVANDGTVYFADSNNHRIRKITANGVVTTLAGNGGQESVDGPGSTAQIRWPTAIALAPNGNVYVKDNWRIRIITPSGVVSTQPGSSYGGIAGLAVDSTGVIYAADSWGHTILKITPAGVVTTFAGSGVAGFADGTGTAARFNEPIGLVLDKDDNLYVADKNNNRLRKITPAGVVTTFSGSGSSGIVDGNSATAQFSLPRGITIDRNGYFYVVQSNYGNVRKIAPDGSVQTLGGSVDGSTVNQYSTSETAAIVVHNRTGKIFVSEWSRIRAIAQ